MGSFRKVMMLLLLLAAFFISLVNLRKSLGWLALKTERGFSNREKGRSFTSGQKWRADMLALAGKRVPKGETCCLWTVPAARRCTSMEGDLIALNYTLYPTRFTWRDESLAEVASVLCHAAYTNLLARQLKEKGLEHDFDMVGRQGTMVIFARKHKNAGLPWREQ